MQPRDHSASAAISCSVKVILNGQETVVKLSECRLCFFHGLLNWKLLRRAASARQLHHHVMMRMAWKQLLSWAKTLQSEHESHTERKAAQPQQTMYWSCYNVQSFWMRRNRAYNHFRPRTWKHALSVRQAHAWHRLWDWAVPLKLHGSSSRQENLTALDKLNRKDTHHFSFDIFELALASEIFLVGFWKHFSYGNNHDTERLRDFANPASDARGMFTSCGTVVCGVVVWATHGLPP